MKLHTASRLAIYATLELARDPERQMSAAEIGEKYAISTHHLAKVLHTLGRAGLVKSMRGAGGGYMFTGNAKRISLLDVIALFEPAGNDLTEIQEPGVQTGEGKVLKQVLDEIDAITWATLGSITLSTMLKRIGV